MLLPVDTACRMEAHRRTTAEHVSKDVSDCVQTGVHRGLTLIFRLWQREQAVRTRAAFSARFGCPDSSGRGCAVSGSSGIMGSSNTAAGRKAVQI